MGKKVLFDGSRAKSKTKADSAADGVDSSNTEEEDEYELEYIKAFTVKENQEMYLIKWKGYAECESTWEPESNVMKIAAGTQKRMTFLKTEYYTGRSKTPKNIVSMADDDSTSADERPKTTPRQRRPNKALVATKSAARRTRAAQSAMRAMSSSPVMRTPTGGAAARSPRKASAAAMLPAACTTGGLRSVEGDPSCLKIKHGRAPRNSATPRYTPTTARVSSVQRRTRKATFTPTMNNGKRHKRNSVPYVVSDGEKDGDKSSNIVITDDEHHPECAVASTCATTEHSDASPMRQQQRIGDNTTQGTESSGHVNGRQYDGAVNDDKLGNIVDEFIQMIEKRGGALCKRCRVMLEHDCVCDVRSLYISQIRVEEDGDKFVRVCPDKGACRQWHSVEMVKRFMAQSLVDYLLEKGSFPDSTLDESALHESAQDAAVSRKRPLAALVGEESEVAAQLQSSSTCSSPKGPEYDVAVSSSRPVDGGKSMPASEEATRWIVSEGVQHVVTTSLELPSIFEDTDPDGALDDNCEDIRDMCVDEPSVIQDMRQNESPDLRYPCDSHKHNTGDDKYKSTASASPLGPEQGEELPVGSPSGAEDMPITTAPEDSTTSTPTTSVELVTSQSAGGASSSGVCAAADDNDDDDRQGGVCTAVVPRELVECAEYRRGNSDGIVVNEDEDGSEWWCARV